MHRKLERTPKAQSPSKYILVIRGIQTQLQQLIMLSHFPIYLYVKAIYSHCEFLLVQVIGYYYGVYDDVQCYFTRVDPFPLYVSLLQRRVSTS